MDASKDLSYFNLKLNKKDMSSYKRKLTSADDDRFSAKTIGLSLGLGVIISVVLAVVLPDACKLMKWLQGVKLKKRYKRAKTDSIH